MVLPRGLAPRRLLDPASALVGELTSCPSPTWTLLLEVFLSFRFHGSQNSLQNQMRHVLLGRRLNFVVSVCKLPMRRSMLLIYCMEKVPLRVQQLRRLSNVVP